MLWSVWTDQKGSVTVVVRVSLTVVENVIRVSAFNRLDEVLT